MFIVSDRSGRPWTGRNTIYEGVTPRVKTEPANGVSEGQDHPDGAGSRQIGQRQAAAGIRPLIHKHCG